MVYLGLAVVLLCSWRVMCSVLGSVKCSCPVPLLARASYLVLFVVLRASWGGHVLFLSVVCCGFVLCSGLCGVVVLC